ncbi:MAG TPA: acyl-CoA dehydrogenase family protein, partial [Roseiarcus sp.]|nr:acyl-CoA dehydrogenase family protein [Roseiarcus sp.]
MRAPAPRAPRDWIEWPFFEPRHRDFAERLDRFVASSAMAEIDHADADRACRKLARALGEAGLLAAAVAPGDGDAAAIDSRAACLARETLAWSDGLADFAFAMQGLGAGAIGLAGSPEMKAAVLPKARAGEWLAAFALSEKEAGSDVAAMACAARLEGNQYVIDGEKTWISNGGIADVYTLFARSGEAPGARGISAFVVFPDDPGFSIAERIEVIAPHPLATLRFDNCRIPKSRLLGAPGGGFKLAMRTLDIFRASVAAAALGFARRALDEALAHARSRRMFGGALADLQL